MWTNPQFPEDLFTFTKEILNGKLHLFDIEYDPFGNSNLSFHVGDDILNLLLLYDLSIFFHE